MAKTEFNRRQALRAFLAGTAGSGLASKAGAQTPPTTVTPSMQLPGTCVLFPQAIEGPYYFDPGLVRDDITEGRPGLPLELHLKIVDANTCDPLANVRVDVWHADADGIYSGYAGQGDNRDASTKGAKYLRGTQFSNDTGALTFRSIYPGWYPGRTPHVHVKAFLDDKTVLTGQIYFPDDVSMRVYHERKPYSVRPIPDTTNASDFIFKQGQKEGGGIVFSIEESAERMKAGLVVAVDRSGKAARSTSWGGRLRSLFTKD